MEDYKILTSYNKIYKQEQKIYKLGNIKLYKPVNLYSALASVVIFIIISIINRLTPLLVWVPNILKFIVLPIVLGSLVVKTKKDGKNLFRYYVSYFEYLLQKNVERERFEPCNEVKEIQFFK